MGTVTATAVSVSNGATLDGSGTIDGILTDSGVLSPGSGTAPGTLTVNGSVNLNNTFIEQIAGLSNFGILDVTNSANLGGTLDIELLGGYVPTVGDIFTFLDPLSVSGTFAQDTFPALPSNEEFIVNYGTSTVEACVVSSGNPVCGATGSPSATPEPGDGVMLALALAGLLGYGLWRRRRGVSRPE
jgi:MYXO-CTERM domain-containing protein